MANFFYQARDQEGKSHSGFLQANSSAHVAEALNKRGFTPITISQTKHKLSSNLNLNRQLLVTDKVKPIDVMMFCRQMHTLMRSDVPILKAIMGLSDSTKSNVFKAVLIDVHDNLEKGNSLSIAMAKHPRVFSKLITSIILVGENTGLLDQSFAQLANYLERAEKTQKNIKKATRYPVYVCYTLLIALVVINVFVLPVFVDMFSQFKTDLPLATRILMGSSDFFIHYFGYILLFSLVLVMILKRYLATPKGRYRWHKIKLRLPLIGKIYEHSYLARFAHSFAIVQGSGIPITSGLRLTADTISNIYMADKVRQIGKNVDSGETLFRAARNSQLFPPLILQMIAVGEETGRVDDLLEHIATYYDEEVEYQLKVLTDRIEPILITFIAAIVLLLALGIFLPMWDMFSVVQS
ncbi:type II secretion system F family protein [Thalassotalea aquiviva]|uniref:type II secretion system F family protein n=1 Tax=Thalassotalea aquiviva TaxID=3242415 RepID=UPI003529D649